MRRRPTHTSEPALAAGPTQFGHMTLLGAVLGSASTGRAGILLAQCFPDNLKGLPDTEREEDSKGQLSGHCVTLLCALPEPQYRLQFPPSAALTKHCWPTASAVLLCHGYHWCPLHSLLWDKGSSFPFLSFS